MRNAKERKHLKKRTRIANKLRKTENSKNRRADNAVIRGEGIKFKIKDGIVYTWTECLIL